MLAGELIGGALRKCFRSNGIIGMMDEGVWAVKMLGTESLELVVGAILESGDIDILDIAL
jgi:hypothetical protein